ncbi:hypothetical protein NBRC111894_577 [Sporolactobacillus inulinus]|uniref:Uncharacterized protein n=1 Tax=Sporolactobacillus inulinus TaxID=2078 RepID=A0A4Y1Z7L6_9BACL|nr:hypothetical protein NBRC111894_577 [Sporolactobacillus inulinus]
MVLLTALRLVMKSSKKSALIFSGFFCVDSFMLMKAENGYAIVYNERSIRIKKEDKEPT